MKTAVATTRLRSPRTNSPSSVRSTRPAPVHELFVDNFAGAGGASTGIEQALGRPVDIAINHSKAALACHEANHPEPRTRHLCEDVFHVDPVVACAGRPVGGVWFSPDCTHHSRAKGGKPRSQKIRGLAWVAIKWARAVRPRVIFLENVKEWLSWGPLDEHGQPIPERAGETFRAWLGQLRELGYVVEWRVLRACDYGAPTTRERLFLVARCDGQPIVWPEPTHGPGRLPYRTAAEIIDWSIPCPSIFGRKKPLADATLRRIAVGVRRYVLESGAPFIVPVTHPQDARVHSIDEPVRTVTAANRGELAFIAPTLIQTGYGEREGQAPRVLDLHAPLGTVVAGGAKHGLVAALLTKHYGGVIGHDVTRPLGTVTAVDHHSVTTAFLAKYYGKSVGQGADEPLHTVTGTARFAEVRALLERFQATPPTNQRSLFDAAEPGYTVTVDGAVYVIADIGMRMLQPRELYRAQGFPEDYVIDPVLDGKPLNKGQQTAHAGNSVPPALARALVAANLGEREGRVAA